MIDKADYCNALALASAQIIAAVHDTEGPADPTPYIDAALSLIPPLGVDRFYALITVLAAQADKETSLCDRLDWVRGFDPAVVAACTRRAS